MGQTYKPGLVGVNLKKIRVRLGLSQEQVAERTGIHPMSVSKLERGERTTPDAGTLEALTRGLGLRPGELLEDASGALPIDDAIASLRASGLSALLAPPLSDDEIAWLRSLPAIFWIGSPPTDESLVLLVQSHRKRRK